MATFRILVTGSRKWTDRERIKDALLCAEKENTWKFPVVLVHGAARGADTLARDVALELGWKTEEHPADWSRGKRAGLARNAEMVSLGADRCLAFILNGSSGARHTADLAEKAGIPTTRAELWSRE